MYPIQMLRSHVCLIRVENACSVHTSTNQRYASGIPCERKRFLKRIKLKRFIRNVLENALRVNAARVVWCVSGLSVIRYAHNQKIGEPYNVKAMCLLYIQCTSGIIIALIVLGVGFQLSVIHTPPVSVNETMGFNDTKCSFNYQ